MNILWTNLLSGTWTMIIQRIFHQSIIGFKIQLYLATHLATIPLWEVPWWKPAHASCTLSSVTSAAEWNLFHWVEPNHLTLYKCVCVCVYSRYFFVIYIVNIYEVGQTVEYIYFVLLHILKDLLDINWLTYNHWPYVYKYLSDNHWLTIIDDTDWQSDKKNYLLFFFKE